MNKEKEQQILLEIVKTWEINELPTFRGFRCANCQEYKNESWHHRLNSGDENGNFIVPVHMCKDTCEPQFQKGTIAVKGESKPHEVDRQTFGEKYQFTDIAKKRFLEIVNSWHAYKEPELKAFTCDDCNGVLEIDQTDGQRKGFHVWWKMPDGKTLTELHFHKSCGQNLGISTVKQK